MMSDFLIGLQYVGAAFGVFFVIVVGMTGVKAAINWIYGTPYGLDENSGVPEGNLNIRRELDELDRERF